jgi:hypothetical protein
MMDDIHSIIDRKRRKVDDEHQWTTTNGGGLNVHDNGPL